MRFEALKPAARFAFTERRVCSAGAPSFFPYRLFPLSFCEVSLSGSQRRGGGGTPRPFFGAVRGAAHVWWGAGRLSFTSHLIGVIKESSSSDSERVCAG